ncbi:DsbA family protein [Actinoplanes sp. NPDC049596]|uniref:DsbA family protein n=1 Tax=unclassified Actinoplanes TaxID=2626549 RepID=UPI00343E501C
MRLELPVIACRFFTIAGHPHTWEAPCPASNFAVAPHDVHAYRRKGATAMTRRALLTYAFDAYCGWCYGFGPALHTFAIANADRIELRVRSGGLFTGPRALPIAAYTHIPDANASITRLTGVTFGDAYNHLVDEGHTVMDSTDAAVGLVALRRQDPARTLHAAEAMQRAWYLDGRSLSDARVYRDLAGDLGYDPDAVTAALAEPGTLTEARADFQQVRRLGVPEYPTLLLHTSNGSHRLGGPLSTADTLTRALDEHFAAVDA